MYADFHGYESLTESDNTVHMHPFMQLCRVMSINFPSVAGVKPIQQSPFSQQNRCRAPIKINCLWRSACLHCKLV